MWAGNPKERVGGWVCACAHEHRWSLKTWERMRWPREEFPACRDEMREEDTEKGANRGKGTRREISRELLR